MKKTKLALSLIVVTIAVATTAIAYAMAATSSNDTQSQNEGCQKFGKMEGRGHFMENANFEKTNIDNGVELTITSDDSDTVAKIQEREQNAPHNKLENDSTITRTVTNLDNGVKITVTSTDPDTVAKLQSDKFKKGFGKMHGRENFMKNANFEKTNIDNGVELTITSDDSDTVAKIQEREQNAPHNKLENDSTITRTVTNLDNGVKITITSTDPDTVAKLQSDKFHKGPETSPKNEQSE